MKKLTEYETLLTETFYRGWHILDYIEAHSNITELDKSAIKATIMDALVTRKCINASTQSLNLSFSASKEEWCIEDNLNYYIYEEYPNVSSIPLHLKDIYRTKSIVITAGIPISLFLARPAGSTHYCIYDPNTAVSSIFENPTFIECIYDSPTRGIRLTESRPFVEIKINKEFYLVDILTKRIFKSDWFKEKYNLNIIHQISVNDMDNNNKMYYLEKIKEYKGLAELIGIFKETCNFPIPDMAEFRYELEKTKEYFPEEWERYELIQSEKRRLFKEEDFSFLKRILKKEDK